MSILFMLAKSREIYFLRAKSSEILVPFEQKKEVERKLKGQSSLD